MSQIIIPLSIIIIMIFVLSIYCLIILKQINKTFSNISNIKLDIKDIDKMITSTNYNLNTLITNTYNNLLKNSNIKYDSIEASFNIINKKFISLNNKLNEINSSVDELLIRINNCRDIEVKLYKEHGDKLKVIDNNINTIIENTNKAKSSSKTKKQSKKYKLLDDDFTNVK